MIAGARPESPQFGTIPRLEKAGIVLLVLSFTSQVYKTLLEGVLPVDLTLLYGALSAAILVAVVLRRGGLAGPQPLALALALLGLYLFPTFYLAGADLSDEYTATKALGFFGFALFSLVAPILYFVDYRRLRFFVRWLLIVSTAVIAYVLLEALVSGTFDRAGFRGRDGGLSANVILLSRIEAGTALLAFLQWRSRDPVLPRPVCLAIFLAMVLAALVTASRGPLFGMVAVLILLHHTNLRDGLSQFKRLGVLLVVLVLGYALAPHVAEILPEASAAKLASIESSARFALWSEALRIFAANPIGVGFGEFAAHTAAPGLSGLYYPHNLVLEYLAETGFVGALCLVLLLARIVLHQRPRADLSDVYTQSFVMFAFLLLQAMVSVDMQGNRLLFCFIGIELVKNALPAVHRPPRRRAPPGRSRASPGPAVGGGVRTRRDGALARGSSSG